MKLSIPNRCTESFDSFRPTSAGGFCQSCQKEVIDFRDMSDGEILSYFAQNQGKTCGSFRPAQLKTYNAPPQQHNRRVHNILGAGVLSFSLFTFLPIIKAQAQTQEIIAVAPDSVELGPTDQVNTADPGYTIEGTIVDEDGVPLPFASVILKGSKQGVGTDSDGKFTLSGLHPGDILIISYIGYESQTYKVPQVDSPNNTPIKLVQKMEMGCTVTLGEVSVEGVYASKSSIWQRIGRAFR